MFVFYFSFFFVPISAIIKNLMNIKIVTTDVIMNFIINFINYFVDWVKNSSVIDLN